MVPASVAAEKPVTVTMPVPLHKVLATTLKQRHTFPTVKTVCHYSGDIVVQLPSSEKMVGSLVGIHEFTGVSGQQASLKALTKQRGVTEKAALHQQTAEAARIVTRTE